MKILLVVFSLVALISISASADDNGVERGDISIHANDSIPKGVEDQIETTIFDYCNLHGAKGISTSYLQVGTDENDKANNYQVQYNVEFLDRLPVIITVTAKLHLDPTSDGYVEIKSFESPICRTFP